MPSDVMVRLLFSACEPATTGLMSWVYQKEDNAPSLNGSLWGQLVGRIGVAVMVGVGVATGELER
jgi:hypothetical protein